MARYHVFFRCVAQAVCARGLRALAGAIPFGDAIYEIAKDALERWRKQQPEEEARLGLGEAAAAPQDASKATAAAVVEEVASTQPEPIQQQLRIYLSLVPATIRQSLKRPADPSGTTVPPNVFFEKPEDLLRFLPGRLPRYRPGDRPAGLGDWELVDLLGLGGFGEVWKARHLYLAKRAPVALKFCLDAGSWERLLGYEATILDQVMSQGTLPGIVPLLHTYLNADPPCLEYEYVEGGELTGLIRDWRRVPIERRVEQVTRVVHRLAAIVGHMHQLKPPVVHRDLKPANVLVQRLPNGKFALRITDFGIGGIAAGHAIERARQGKTTRGELLLTELRGSHTPLYASPQQKHGGPPDPRDDVHALGVIWYQMLMGDPNSGVPPEWVDELSEKGVGEDVIQLLRACVTSNAEKRLPDAAVLAERLAKLVGTGAVMPPPPQPPPKGELRVVRTRSAIRDSLRNFNTQARAHPDRALRLLKTTHYWLYDPSQGVFGPSKFVGFADMDFDRYELAINDQLAGDPCNGTWSRTALEYVLGKSFEDQPALHSRLEEWGRALLGRDDVFAGIKSSKWRFLSFDSAATATGQQTSSV